jgi:4'-phosphopantetheinyl transferase
VHLWCCSTTLDAMEAEERRAILSGPERARADRYRTAEPAFAFVAARSWLRLVLAAYTAIPAARIRFDTTPNGKLSLADDIRVEPITFNLSHSGNVAIVAVAGGMELGVDVERVRPVSPDVVAGCLAPAEAAALAALPPALREEAFIRCWTRKEAFLKATGAGLTVAPSDIAVSLDPLSAAVLEIAADADEAAHWQLADLSLAPGYCGALAARQRGWSAIWMTAPDPTPASEAVLATASLSAPLR